MNNKQLTNTAVLTTVYFDPAGELALNRAERWTVREGFADGPKGFIPAWMILKSGMQAASLDAPELPAWLIKGLATSGHNTALIIR